MKFYNSSLNRVLTGVCLLVLAVSIFNVLVDPYAVFDVPRRAGFNEFKPFAGDRGRVGKLHQVARAAPHGLIVGNSRAEMGLSPEHPCWPSAARPVFNIALPGLSVYQQVRYAQHAQAAAPARALLMAVDLSDFIHRELPPADPARWPPAHADIDAEPFAVDPDGRPVRGFQWVRLADYVDAAVSLAALGHSLATLARQGGETVPTRTPSGLNPAEATFQPIVRFEGPLVLFEQKNREIANRLNDAEWHLFAPGEAWSPDFEALRRIIRQSRDAGAATVLLIGPYHADYLMLLDAAGLWPQFEAWKRRLAELARVEGVPLWDFSGFDRYSTESVDGLPPRGTSLEWFWEPAHYRRELGDLVLANIWRAHCPSDHAEAPPYGVLLDRGGDAAVDIDAHLAAQRAYRDTYKVAHPDVVLRIGKLFEQ
jgi:hypothetical protein